MTTLVLYGLALRHETEHVRHDFDDVAGKFMARFHRATDDFENVLLSSVALVRAHPELSSESWGEFVGSLQLPRRCPGFQGLGYLQRVGFDRWRAAQEAIAGAQADLIPASDSAGDLGGSLTVALLNPESSRTHRFLTTTDPQSPRRVAMERARDLGRLATTAGLQLSEDGDRKGQVGLIIYAPVFGGDSEPQGLERRRQALTGFIALPINLADFVAGLMRDRNISDHHVRVAIFDGSEVSSTCRSSDGTGRCASRRCRIS